jgi:hypothetical protein
MHGNTESSTSTLLITLDHRPQWSFSKNPLTSLSSPFLDATIAQWLDMSHHASTMFTYMIGTLRTIHHQRYPARWPEYPKHDKKHEPCFEGWVGRC